MKSAKKALLLALCGCLLVAGSIVGSMAYFTDAASVTNTFTIGKVGISLDEAITDEYGVDQGKRTVDAIGNEYKIIPGHTYVKDPTVTVDADSEEAYIRMLVEITNYDSLSRVFDNTYYVDGVFLLQNLVDGWDSAKWVSTNKIDTTTVPGSAIYEFRYYKTVSTVGETDAQPLEPLFESFTIPGALVTMDNISVFDSIDIIVTAQAIQADGFADADAAWSKF